MGVRADLGEIFRRNVITALAGQWLMRTKMMAIHVKAPMMCKLYFTVNTLQVEPTSIGSGNFGEVRIGNWYARTRGGWSLNLPCRTFVLLRTPLCFRHGTTVAIKNLYNYDAEENRDLFEKELKVCLLSHKLSIQKGCVSC